MPTRSAKAHHRDKENAFCIRNKPFLFLSVSFAQGMFLPTRNNLLQHRDKENAFCIRNKPFLFFSGFFCTGNVFCPLAVQKHIIGTKKTLSASEINRFYFLAVSFAQETFLPTRSNLLQFRDKENAFCIRNKPFLFFSGFSCTGNVFCPLAVIYYSFGTKKTLSASEINRFYFLAVSFAQGTFLPTRSNLLQLRDKESAFCIRNKPFLFFSGFSCTGNVFAHSQCKSTASGQRNAFCIRNKPFLFFCVFFAQGTFFAHSQ